ncbi:hypothetical protein, partial [Alkalicoccus luteus]|uniref:hypothetical protein n=1 Tax=Alkalicoccus luteus TaxID=1237094 RepID=UPI00197B4ED4
MNGMKSASGAGPGLKGFSREACVRVKPHSRSILNGMKSASGAGLGLKGFSGEACVRVKPH